VKPALERCLRQLVIQGKKYGGYITYQIITDVLHDKQCDLSMDAIDHIYEYLTAEGINIVDELPHIESPDNGDGFESFRRREVIRRKRSFKYIHAEKSGGIKYSLCPEEAIDKLLYQWETTGQLSTKYFFTIVKRYRLSKLEVIQLIDYLGSLGVEIDITNYSLKMFFDNNQKRFGINEDGEQDSLKCDPFVQMLINRNRCKPNNYWW